MIYQIEKITDKDGNEKTEEKYLHYNESYLTNLHLSVYSLQGMIFTWEWLLNNTGNLWGDGFHTSRVEKIIEEKDKFIILTKNSIYYLKKIKVFSCPPKR